MTENGSSPPTPTVQVRIESHARGLQKDELRLGIPLEVGGQHKHWHPLPEVRPEISEATITRIHDLLSALATANRDGRWWYLPVSEWQEVMSALPMAVEWEARIASLVPGLEGHRLVLTIPNAFQAAYLLRQFSGHPQITVSAQFRDRASWWLDRAKTRPRRWVNMTRWLLGHAREYGKPAGPPEPDRFPANLTPCLSAASNSLWNKPP